MTGAKKLRDALVARDVFHARQRLQVDPVAGTRRNAEYMASLARPSTKPSGAVPQTSTMRQQLNDQLAEMGKRTMAERQAERDRLAMTLLPPPAKRPLPKAPTGHE
jgi:hypothetical protein